MTGLFDLSTIYKSFCPKEAVKLEFGENKVMDSIENQYINPFNLVPDKYNLADITSGLIYQNTCQMRY